MSDLSDGSESDDEDEAEMLALIIAMSLEEQTNQLAADQRDREKLRVFIAEADGEAEHDDCGRMCYLCFEPLQPSSEVTCFGCDHWLCADCPHPTECGICRQPVETVSTKLLVET